MTTCPSLLRHCDRTGHKVQLTPSQTCAVPEGFDENNNSVQVLQDLHLACQIGLDVSRTVHDGVHS